ncbi:hypothetical protein CL614_06275 [archaeon]|nr:hypothetical protein [archaeon]
MKMKLFFILLLAIIVLVSGCANLVVTPTFNEEIDFTIKKTFTNDFDGIHLYLGVSTKQSFSCSNYGITHNINSKNNTIKIVLGEIIKPNICLTSFGPAGFSEELDLNEGTYVLEFHASNKIDRYYLKNFNKSIIIEPIEKSFSYNDQTQISYDIVKNLLWTKCFYNSDWKFDPNDGHCEKFFDEIETIAQPYLIAEEGKTPRNQFYLYTGEDQTLIDLMQKHNREGFYIRISTWEGKSFICHLNCRPYGVANMPGSKIEYLPEPITNVSECNDSISCIMTVAFNIKNETICDQIPETNQGQCFGQVGIAKLNESLCEKTDNCFTCQEDCYSYISIKKSNPDLCEELTSIYKDRCYISYAKAKSDISFCDKVIEGARIKQCLDNFKSL